VAFALAVAATYACNPDHDDNPFREDVLGCEEAVARLVLCCPAIDAHRIACAYSFDRHDGCWDSSVTTTVVEPALSTTESACVLDLDCDALVARGVCERAEQAFPYRRTTSSSDGRGPALATTTHPPVCP
jgi:hypothetical protein